MAKVRLSAALGGLSGPMGNVVFSETKFGTVMRARPSRGRERTAAQQQIGQNLRRANAAWRALSAEQVQAWQLYCLGLTEENPATGMPFTPQAVHVFLGYATKILQMNPLAEVPTGPPSEPFYGDAVRCALAVGPGGLTVTASSANAAGVTTEILVQKLRQVNNAPQPRSYKTATFKSFAPGSLSVSVPLTKGAYAVAIRFVDIPTGRKTPVYPVGRVVVG